MREKLKSTLRRAIPIGAAMLCSNLAGAATITVTGTGDTIAVDGVVTLREAITSINNGANVNADVVAIGAYGTNDTINFNIAGSGVQTIAPTTSLPTINKGVLIDGYSQPGTSANTLAHGTNAVLKIVISGSTLGGFGTTDGVVIGSGVAGAVTLRGLVISTWREGISVVGGANHTIAGCFIGVDPTGTTAVPTEYGVLVGGGISSVTIGGTTPAARNVISGNGGIDTSSDCGLAIYGVSTTIQGNLVGTNAAGTAAIANNIGIYVTSFATGTQIGGTAVGAGNVISGNVANGITSTGTGTVIQGNLIGTDVSGTSSVGNAASGVYVYGGTTIGGTAAGAGNAIAFNGAGVLVAAGTGTSIRGNDIFSNTGLGINLGGSGPHPNDSCDGDTGVNNLQNFPLLATAFSSGGSTTIQGTLNSVASTLYAIDLFSSSACDPSGYGQGQTYLGSTTATTDTSCNASFSVTLPVSVPNGDLITATATDPGNNTSEFSLCLPVRTPLNRVFVSTDGSDASPCTQAAPCRTLGQAMATVTPSGEVIIVKSGGYGPFTIAKAVSIYVPKGIYAGLTAFSGDGITIEAGSTDLVSIEGLTINALGGVNGIHILSGGAVKVAGCEISGFTTGVLAESTGDLLAADMEVRDSTAAGISVNPIAASKVTLRRCRLERNASGLSVAGGSSAEFSESVASANTSAGITCSSGDVSIEDSLLAVNGTGAAATGTGHVRLSDSIVTNNATGLQQSGSGVFLTRGNNTVEGNATNTSGTIGSYPAR